MDSHLKRLYVHHLLFTFAESIHGVFLPVFLYKLSGSVATTFFLYAAFWAVGLVCLIPGFNFSIARGAPRRGLIAGMLCYALSLLLLSVQSSLGLLSFVGWVVFFALYLVLYWYPRHWTTAQLVSHETIGSQMSKFIQLGIFAGFLGPLVGGLLAHNAGLEVTLHLGATLMVISIIPLLRFSPPVTPERVSWQQLRVALRDPHYTRLQPIFVGEAWLWHLFGTSWALAFFLFIGSLETFGIIVSLSSLVAIIGSRVVGSIFDGTGRRAALLTTTYIRVLVTALYAFVPFTASLVAVAVLESANRVAAAVQASVADAYIQSFGKRMSPLLFHANREITLLLTRIALCSGLGVWFLYFPISSLWVLIPLGALGLLPSLRYGKFDPSQRRAGGISGY